MSETVIYKIPLYEAYKYSLIYKDCIHPDSLDLEGTLHQRLVYDTKKRLIRVENYKDGELVTEKTFSFDGDRLMKEREYFVETESVTEIIYSYSAEGYRKGFFTHNELEASEIYVNNEKGVVGSCQCLDSENEVFRSWQANEKGDIVYFEEKGKVIEYDYVYNADGLIEEIVITDEKGESREVRHYENKNVVKIENFSDGECIEYTLYEYNKDGKIIHTERYQEGVCVNETAIETDPAGLYEVHLQKQLGGYRAGARSVERYRTGKVEILYDEDRRMSEILASDYPFIDAALGISLDADAYYFFEYED
jgi:antitoxin component YwqK of YwqJK toxin-antitoxin module